MLLPAPDTSAADWLVERLTTFGEFPLSIVPRGFEAYARVLHPAGDLRWADVAAAAGTRLAAESDWTEVAGVSDYWTQRADGVFSERPEEGSMPEEIARVLRDVLNRHTSSERWWFATWHGFGTTYVPGVESAPTFDLPGRTYYLSVGSAADVTASVWADFGRQSANIWWPDDRAWCVATEIDLVWTYVAASADAVMELVVRGELEAFRL